MAGSSFRILEMLSCEFPFKAVAKASALQKRPQGNEATYPELFEEDTFFICYRQTRVKACVERAMAEIYRLFLGYFPQIVAIEEMDEQQHLPDVFNAHRGYKHFQTWSEAYLEDRNTLCGLKITDDGMVQAPNGSKRPIRGLATIMLLAYIFATTDMYSDNFGVSLQADAVYGCKIDEEASLDLDNLALPITQDDLTALPEVVNPDYTGFLMKLPKEITQSAAFKAEKKAAINAIATIDFALVEAIIRKHLDFDRTEDAHHFLKKMFLAKQIPQAAYQQLLSQPLSAEQRNPCQTIIQMLRARFDAVREIQQASDIVPEARALSLG